MKIKFLFIPLAAAFCTARAQTIPFDPAVRTGKLANGFTYYIRHNEEPKNRVVFYLANKVGSVLENDNQQGLAHFMEHMSFNGTKNFPKNELVNYLQKSGVRFGADLNAYTSFDETVYQLPIPSDKPELLNKGIQIMRDWAHGATLDAAEINKERGVVLEEKRLGKGAQERMQRIYYPVILNRSRYSVRIPIGLDTVLDNFKPETIRSFYHDWYRPDLQALIVVGDVNVDEMEKAIKAKFSDLKNPANERPRIKYTVPLTGKNQFIAITDPEMTTTSLEVMIKQPELPLHTALQYRQTIVRQLFNGLMGERYGELLRSANPPFLQAGAGVNSFIGGLDNFDIMVEAKPGELENGFKAAWRETNRVKRFGFTNTELARAKDNYIKQFEAMFKEKDKTNSEGYVQEYLQYFLKGTASPGIAYEYKLVKSAIAGITLDELNELAKSGVKSSDRDIILMAPAKEKANLPSELVVSNWIKAVDAENLKPFTDEVSKEALLPVQPQPGKIVQEQNDPKLGITTLTLSNGVSVLLKPTDFKNNEILFSGFAAGGTSLYSDADYESAKAAAIFPSFGAGNYNKTELNKYLSGKQLSVQPFISERTQGVNGGSVNNDLETALQLVYAYFTAPRKDTTLFQTVIDRSKAGILNRMNDPNSVFQDTIYAVLGDHNVRRTGATLEKINQINMEKAFAIYKERFADASGFTFVFTGSIDVAVIRPLLEKYLGGLPAIHKNEQAKDLHLHIPDGVIERSVYKGTEPKATVRLVLSGPFDYNFENVIKMDALKETLEIRLLERLREDESGVYSPNANVITTKLPESRFSLTISFGCSPQNADKLIASTLDEINKLKTVGPPQVNVDKFRAEELRTTETQLKTNEFWLGYLSGQLQNQEALDQINSYSAGLNKVTPADVRDMAAKYLTGKNYIKLVLIPEKTQK